MTSSRSETASPKEVSPDGQADAVAGDVVAGHVAAGFPIVAIGASAGGLEALELLVGRLRPCGAAFLIMQHHSPHFRSSLAEILARSSGLPVQPMQDGQRIVRDVIYVAPAGAEVHVEHGCTRLRELAERARQHPVDTMFRALAHDQGPSAIAVVLSGAGSDGSLGIRAVKEEGGITFVQDPASAGQGGMPQSALESGCVDFCLAPTAIADELMLLGVHPYVVHRRRAHRLNPELLSSLFEQLRRMWGVDFSSYKASTVERRIERRMALQHLERPLDYLKLVEENRSELKALYADLLIGVTGFFRDLTPFEYLKSSVFPALLERRDPELPIRIWVPGCATGEEAYSIIMCLLEYIEHHQPAQRLQVFATDIDEQALARARQGIYPPGIELDVSAERLQRFFSRTEKGYQVSRKLRDMVVFARHNLGKDPPFSRLDLVSCRNLLIYMQPALQKKVMRVFHYALNPRGFLLLGSAESVGDASDLFSLLDRKLKFYAKKHASSPGVLEFAFGSRQEESLSGMTRPVVERKPEVSLQQLVDRKILDKYGPPGVLIDETANILQFRGQTGPFLAPSPGAATLSILRMIRPELLVPLKAALHRALHDGLQVSCEPVRMSDGAHKEIAMDLVPIDAAGHGRCLLVLFRELEPPSQAHGAGAEPAVRAEASMPEQKRTQELEHELLTTKEYLETIIQELATSNEELQSSNEELQSSNEELQSTNEELETSKEELQASNEELVTVNEELQARITQLGVANDDLINVLVNVTSPVVLVGLDLRIRRFSAAAERLLNLISKDVGRPISYLGTTLNVPQIESTVSEVIDTMRSKEIRVRCSNAGWYTMRIAPYQTADRAIRGVVIELIQMTAPHGIWDVTEIPELVAKVLSTLPHELVLLDQSLRIVWANEAFQRLWGANLDTLGRSLDALLPRSSTPESLWTSIENAAFTGQPFEELHVMQTPGGDAPQNVRWSGRSIPAEAGRGALTLLTVERAS
jgi:two-component system CheB/CheR fusion protein